MALWCCIECCDVSYRFPRREDVDQSNSRRLQQLTTRTLTYRAVDSGEMEPVQRNKVLANFMATTELTLKVDAQVRSSSPESYRI